MSCELWHEKLDQYVDAEMAGNEAAEMDDHLRQCPSCAAEALGRVRLKKMTHAVGNRFVATPKFKLKIAKQVEARSRFRAGVWKWGLAAATAALAVAIGLASLWYGQNLRQRQFGEIADLHVGTLASPNPVDVVSSDRHTVKPWFAGKLPFTFNVPEFENTPFQLVGGRVAYFEQTPGAQLLLNVRKHHLSVFIFPEQALGGRLSAANTVEHKLEFTIQTWSQNGLRYFVISDASPADVAALSDLLKRAA